MAFADFSKYKVFKTASLINHNDPEKEIINGSSSHGSSEFSSAYISPETSPQMNKKKKSLEVCCSKQDQFDSLDLSSICVKPPPNDPWATSISYDDKSSLWSSSSSSTLSFDNAKENLAPSESHTNTSTTFLNDFTYALLSNYSDTFYDESICKF